MCVNFIFKRLEGDPSQIQLKDILQFFNAIFISLETGE